MERKRSRGRQVPHTWVAGGGAAPGWFTRHSCVGMAVSVLACAPASLDAKRVDQVTPRSVQAKSLPALGECGTAATPIHTLQGDGPASTRVGQVAVVEAVVVGDFQAGSLAGVFLQEEDHDWDADPATSEGIFVYGLPIDVVEGDRVRAVGTVAEHRGLTELEAVTGALRCGTGPAPATTTLRLPVEALADFEALEGMRVRLPQPLTVTDNFRLGRFGSLGLSANGRLYQPTAVVAPGPPARALADLNGRSHIVLDDASTEQNPTPIPYLDAQGTRRIGDELTGLVGILSGRFDRYRVQPTAPPVFRPSNPRPQRAPEVGGNLTVGVVNVHNFFTSTDESGALCGPSRRGCRGADSVLELSRQRRKLLHVLTALDADILALQEVENNATASARSLTSGLNEGPSELSYEFVDTGTLGSDAVKVALLYRPATVALAGSYAILDRQADSSFVDTRHRPSLAQTFVHRTSGMRITVVNNHLKSKGSACDDAGDPDLGDGQGHCNQTRLAAARALHTWVRSDPTGGGTDRVLLVGDFNAYAMEDPMSELKGAGFESLVESFAGPQATSYVFEGQSGSLSHALSSPSLAPYVTGAASWPINADEPAVLDYNLEFKTHDPFNADQPFRASDHDPLLVGLQLAPSCERRAAP